ncbi:MAG: hypothetical protein CMN34_08130 [Saprospirales bacterium]|nr:hypothetical protein [Saprospirales bacterium]|tara:strand:+ start:906 stop:1346 length:441 start_codon:yes stop_codon:yes gene_type:complete
MRIITQWLLVCSVLMGGVYFFPSSVQIDPLYMALVLGAVIRVLNATLRPLLLLFTLPFTLFTLGLFILVVNGFVFHLAARWVDGVSYSFAAAFLLALVTAALDSITQDKKKSPANVIFHQFGGKRNQMEKDEIEDVPFIEVKAKKE